MARSILSTMHKKGKRGNIEQIHKYGLGTIISRQRGCTHGCRFNQFDEPPGYACVRAINDTQCIYEHASSRILIDIIVSPVGHKRPKFKNKSTPPTFDAPLLQLLVQPLTPLTPSLVYVEFSTLVPIRCTKNSKLGRLSACCRSPFDNLIQEEKQNESRWSPTRQTVHVIAKCMIPLVIRSRKNPSR